MKYLKFYRFSFCFLLCLCPIVVAGQEINRKELFMQFEARFGLSGYPFIFSNDYDKMTKPGVYSNSLPENMQEEFIYSQGIKPFTFICDMESFGGFRSYIKFPQGNNIYLFVVTLDLEPGCGEAVYLLTYSDNYQLIDHIMVRAVGQFVDIDQRRKVIFIESVLTEDSINVTRRERLLPFKVLEDRVEFEVIYYDFTYIINEEGKFVLIREERSEGVEYE